MFETARGWTGGSILEYHVEGRMRVDQVDTTKSALLFLDTFVREGKTDGEANTQ